MKAKQLFFLVIAIIAFSMTFNSCADGDDSDYEEIETPNGDDQYITINAGDFFEVDGILYKIDTSLTEVIVCTKGTGNEYSGDIIIPSEIHYGGKTFYVTKIDDSAFSQARELTSISLPNTLRSIGHQAFLRCSQLKSIEIPMGVTSIKSGAFLECENLEAITIPNTVTEIGNAAFLGCSALKSLDFPDGLKIIERQTCNECKSLENVKLPNSISKIGSFAFADCAFYELFIPESVTIIENEAFNRCKNLISIILPDNLTAISYGTFLNCDILDSVTIPKNITTIGENAFRNCKSLSFIELPNGLESIEKYAFSNTKLDEGSIISKIEEPEKCALHVNSFDDYVYSYTTLYVPKQSLDSYRSAAVWNKFKKRREIE